MDNQRKIYLESIVDKHGKTPKLGDFVRFTLYNGIDNVVAQIKECDKFGYSPAFMKYLEFEIFDGVMNEDDIHIDDIYK